MTGKRKCNSVFRGTILLGSMAGAFRPSSPIENAADRDQHIGISRYESGADAVKNTALPCSAKLKVKPCKSVIALTKLRPSPAPS